MVVAMEIIARILVSHFLDTSLIGETGTQGLYEYRLAKNTHFDPVICYQGINDLKNFTPMDVELLPLNV